MDLINLNTLLVLALVGAAVATVMTARLLRAVILLAITSAVLAVIMFRLNSPLAAVFELSVCAGLIPAIFLSAISMTKRLDPDSLTVRLQENLRINWLLPILVIIAGVTLTQVPVDFGAVAAAGGAAAADVRTVLWTRHLDILGQVIVLLGGAYGVAVLVKEYKS